jgi:ClpP class serine protease
MSVTDLFWIFFILVSLQPAIRQRLLEMARLRTLRRLEQKRGSRVIALIHRQETLALLGFPLFRYIDINDSEEVLRAVRLTAPDVPIDLILHTPGGLVLAAEQIAYALCCREAPVTVFVPHYAMSGGTLIALAAHEIVMDQNAVLGPVDPQLDKYPAVSILKAVARKDVNELDDETLILADVAEKAIRQVKDTVAQIVEKRAERQAAEALAEKLASGTWTHDYPITVGEARRYTT